MGFDGVLWASMGFDGVLRKFPYYLIPPPIKKAPYRPKKGLNGAMVLSAGVCAETV